MTLSTRGPPRRAARSGQYQDEDTESLLDRMRHAIVEDDLLRCRARVVVGVSGGPDSVALLHLLTLLQPAFSLTLFVVHVDHRLREESGDDAAFVQRLAERLRLPVTIERRDVRAMIREHGWSPEDGARRVRYQCLSEVARRLSADAIAVGHTADDQAETVLMRLLRGAGLAGLSAIPVKRLLGNAVWVVRPLLGAWRWEILDHLERAELPYRHDVTNDDLGIVRNRIRHELIPQLEARYNPQIKAALVQVAEQSRCDNAYLQAAAARQWRRLARPLPGGEVVISIHRLLRQPKPLQRQLIRHLVREMRGELTQFEFRHWAEAERLLLSRPRGTVLDLPGGLRMIREDGWVRCVGRPPDAEGPSRPMIVSHDD